MKTKRLQMIAFLVLLSMSTFAQLNPVQNLYFQRDYQYGNTLCPDFNCYTLSWNAPVASSDTLIGYYIYKNEIPYAFTSLTNASCNGIIPCNYHDFFATIPFWLSVRAVYNTDSLISEATDSVYITGIMIGIDDLKEKPFSLIKNPIRPNESISLFIPQFETEKSLIQIISQNGQIVMEYTINNASNSIITLPSNQLSQGFYIISMKNDKNKLSTKLVIQE